MLPVHSKPSKLKAGKGSIVGKVGKGSKADKAGKVNKAGNDNTHS